MKPNGAGAAARGRGNPPKSLCLPSTHQRCLCKAITEASGAFTPIHLGLRVLNNLICLMTREAPGPPCCLDLLSRSPKGFSGRCRQPPPRTGGHWRAFVEPTPRQVLRHLPQSPKVSDQRTFKPLRRVCPSAGRAELVGRDGGRAAPGQTVVWRGKGKTKQAVRCCFGPQIQPKLKQQIWRNWDAPALAAV